MYICREGNSQSAITKYNELGCQCYNWKAIIDIYSFLFPFCSLDSNKRLQTWLKQTRTRCCTLLTELVTSMSTTWRSLPLSKNQFEVSCIFFLPLALIRLTMKIWRETVYQNMQNHFCVSVPVLFFTFIQLKTSGVPTPAELLGM